jgi:ABC-2 type transport system ATP-binding protein
MTLPTPIAPTPAVELRNVSKRFDKAEALRDVVAILGPNGAGKTTAISIMLGIRKPTSGEAQIFGMDPHDLRARARCGVMLQDTGLPWNLKVGELVALFRSYYPAPLSSREILEVAGLTKLVGKRAFALAICGNPSLLFLDEPTVGLDVDSRKAFWREMKRYAAKGASIVMTTHYMEEAEALADRIVVIHDGQVVADASSDALTSRIDRKRVRIRVPGDTTSTAFAGLAVEDLEVNQGVATFTAAEPEVVLHDLWLRKIAYQTIEIRGAALEDAVANLTNHTGEEPHVRSA